MTIQDLEPRVEYIGTGTVTIFNFAFEAVETDDINATVDDIDTHPYTVAFNSDQESNPGGIVTFDTAPGLGTVVAIYRTTDITQETAYPNYDRFPAQAHEAALDKITMILQEIWASLSKLWTKALILPEANPIQNEVPSVEDRSNKYFFWDSEGNPAVSSGTAGGGGSGDCSIQFKVGAAPGFNDLGHCDQTCYALSVEWLENNLGIGRDCEENGYGIEVDNDADLGRIMHGAYVNASNFSGPNGTVPSGLTLAHKISPYQDPDAVVVGVDKVGDIWRYYADPTQPGLEDFKGNWEKLSNKADLNGDGELFRVASPNDDNGVFGFNAINSVWLADHLGIGYVGGPGGTYLAPKDDNDLASYLQMAYVGIGSTLGFPGAVFRGFKCADTGTPIDLIGVDIGTGEIWTYTSPTGATGSFDGTWNQALADAPTDGNIYARLNGNWSSFITGDVAVGDHEAETDPHPQYITAEDLPSNIVDWFTNNPNPLPGGYLLLANSQTGEAEANIAVVCPTVDMPVLIEEWLREDNFTEDFEWLETLTTFVLDFNCTENNGEIYTEIWHLKVDTTEILLATSSRQALSNIRDKYVFTVPIAGPIIMEVGDNIITRIYANKKEAGTDPTVTFYMEGTTQSRMTTLVPVPTIPGPHAPTHEDGGIDQIDHNNLLNATGQLTHAQIDIELGQKLENVVEDLSPALGGDLTLELYKLNADIPIDGGLDVARMRLTKQATSEVFTIDTHGEANNDYVMLNFTNSDSVDCSIKFSSSGTSSSVDIGGPRVNISALRGIHIGGMQLFVDSIALDTSKQYALGWIKGASNSGASDAQPIEINAEPTSALVDATRPFEYTVNNVAWIAMLFERLDEETDSNVVRQNPSDDSRFDFLEAGLYQGYVTFYVVGPLEWGFSINGTLDSETQERNGFSASSENYKITIPFSFRVNANDYLQFIFRKWGTAVPVIQPYATIFIQRKTV